MKPGLQLSVQYASTHDCPSRAQLRRWVRGALTLQGATHAALLLRFVDHEEGQVLNRDYRGKNYATNVLTFNYQDEAGDLVSADIIVCAAVVEQEARAQGKTLHDHYAHLVVHGVLHACGYDHEQDDQASIMENLEREVLRRFRIADPYRDDHVDDDSSGHVSDQTG